MVKIWNWNKNLVSESRQFSFLGQNFSWSKYICDWFKLQQHRSSCRSTWRTSVTVECESCCSQIKGKSKTTKERNCWITEHYSNEWKKVDWHWTRRILSLCARGLEESRQSSSTLSNDTTGTWRSSSILENQVLSSESVSTKPILVGWSVENMLGSRRRIKKKISVLLWYFRNNFFYLRAFQRHSGRSLIDPSLQDNVIIQWGLFQHIYHIGCAF